MTKSIQAPMVNDAFTVDLANDSPQKVSTGRSITQAITTLNRDPDLMIFRLNGTLVADPDISFPKPGDIVMADYRVRGA